jgi:serine/threonine-protein kinase RsbW
MHCYAVSSLDEFSGVREQIRSITLKLCPDRGELLFVALNEAVNNALFHGNDGDNKKLVEIILTLEDNQVCICIRDQGRGFNYRTRQAANEELHDHGRGLAIMQYCADVIEFNEDGNEIILRKNIN